MNAPQLIIAILGRMERVSGPDAQGWHTGICPFHDDHRPSLRVNVNGFKCMACGEKGTLRKLALKLELQVPVSNPGGNRTHTGQGVTLAQLAQAKGLPIESLEELGWHDVDNKGQPAVAIPHKDTAGNIQREQLRVRLEKSGKKDTRFYWAPGHGI